MVIVGTYKQKYNGKGSLKLIQTLVNDYPHVLTNKLSTVIDQPISWVSPLKEEGYAEYRDQTFLQMLGINQEIIQKLDQFWPKNGPQWDALGKFSKNGVLLVEAKANLAELESPASAATNPLSRQLIEQSLDKTKKYIGVTHSADWTKKYYQYCNRLAHLHFLSVNNKLPVYLIFIYFIGDESVNGPTSQEQWEAAIEKKHKVLGIPNQHPLKPYIIDIFIDVYELKE